MESLLIVKQNNVMNKPIIYIYTQLVASFKQQPGVKRPERQDLVSLAFYDQ